MLLNVSNVAKAYAGDVILSGVTFRLEAREKVALIGRNGAGKTTLLRILTGQIEPDSGSVNMSRGAKIGYLKQEAPVGKGRTVLEEAKEAIRAQMEMRERLDELEKILDSGKSTNDDLEEYTLLHDHFIQQEGYNLERDLKMVLQRMGFTEDEFSKSTDSLSGGEKTRLAIARLLLEEPDLLILDEPTNHLDLQATEWLEGWLRQYRGAVLLVSHDRAFLSNTSERTLEMIGGTVKSYPGNFEKYLKLREEELERQAEVAKRQGQEIAKMDEYVRRFMNSQRTAQARGRLKLMNRLIESKVEAPKNEKGIKGGFTVSKRSGDLVAETVKLRVGFENGPLFPDLDWTVANGERWGVIGENGAGKSTLIKVLLGLMDPLAGTCRLGANVIVGYFSQDTTDLNPEISPIDMMVYEMDLKPAEARNLLARFLITGDDVYRPIRTLSGGEKNKLSLAQLTQLAPNVLVLDEPTNHLDMDSREALAKIIQEYEGTLILVSHDRWLLSQVTDHTLDIRVKGARSFPGSYEEYRRRERAGTLDGRAPIEMASKAPVAVEVKQEPALSPRELSKEIQRLEKSVVMAEKDVASRESALKDLEEQLANLPTGADVVQLTKRHHQLTVELNRSLADWEDQSNRLSELQASRT